MSTAVVNIAVLVFLLVTVLAAVVYIRKARRQASFRAATRHAADIRVARQLRAAGFQAGRDFATPFTDADTPQK